MSIQCDVDGCDNDGHTVIDSASDEELEGMVYCKKHIELLLFGTTEE